MVDVAMRSSFIIFLFHHFRLHCKRNATDILKKGASKAIEYNSHRSVGVYLCEGLGVCMFSSVCACVCRFQNEYILACLCMNKHRRTH